MECCEYGKLPECPFEHAFCEFDEGYCDYMMDKIIEDDREAYHAAWWDYLKEFYEG